MMKMKEEKIYIYIALVVGILFVFLVPPFQSPDEDSHFKKSYEISSGKLYSIEKGGKAGNYFPNDMLSYIDDKLTYIGNRDKKYTFSEFTNDQYSKINYDDKKFVSYSTSNVLPIIYMAPAIGITFSKLIAKIFGMSSISPAYMLYFARLFSLLFSCFLIYKAIKITPILKKTMLTIGLIPMTVYLSSMVTYDNVLLACTLLSSAVMLDLIFNKKREKISKKQILILSLIGIVLLNVKIIYFFSYLLLLFVPKKKYGSEKKESIKNICVMGAIIIVGTIVLKIPYMLQDLVGGNNLFGKQLMFIIENPLKYSKILLDNVINQRQFQLIGMIGMFGLVDTYLPVSLVGLYLIYFIVFILVEASNSKYVLSLSKKGIILLYILFAVASIYTIMYIDWTTQLFQVVGGTQITGVQGRYFLPLLYPFSLLFINRKKNISNLGTIVLNNYLIIPLIMLAVSLIVILLRFWA